MRHGIKVDNAKIECVSDDIGVSKKEDLGKVRHGEYVERSLG